MEARVETFSIAVDGDRLAATLSTPPTFAPRHTARSRLGRRREHDLAARARSPGWLYCLTFDLRGTPELHPVRRPSPERKICAICSQRTTS